MSVTYRCDRCGFIPAQHLTEDVTNKTVTVPAKMPAGSDPNGVAADCSVTIALASAQDLCAVCLASTLKRYVKDVLGAA